MYLFASLFGTANFLVGISLISLKAENALCATPTPSPYLPPPPGKKSRKTVSSFQGSHRGPRDGPHQGSVAWPPGRPWSTSTPGHLQPGPGPSLGPTQLPGSGLDTAPLTFTQASRLPLQAAFALGHCKFLGESLSQPPGGLTLLLFREEGAWGEAEPRWEPHQSAAETPAAPDPAQVPAGGCFSTCSPPSWKSLAPARRLGHLPHTPSGREPAGKKYAHWLSVSPHGARLRKQEADCSFANGTLCKGNLLLRVREKRFASLDSDTGLIFQAYRERQRTEVDVTWTRGIKQPMGIWRCAQPR